MSQALPPSFTCPVTWTCPQLPGQNTCFPANVAPSARSPHGHICIFIGIFACHRCLKYTGMVVQCDRGTQLQHLLTGLSIIETRDQYNLPSTLVIHHSWPVDDSDSARLVTTWQKKTWRKIKMYLWIAFAVCSRKQPDTYRSVGGATANQSVLHGGSLKYFLLTTVSDFHELYLYRAVLAHLYPVCFSIKFVFSN